MLIHFENLGCRLNQSETEALANAFLKAGFTIFNKTKNETDVLLVFVNTCTVTSKAEQKCRHTIRSCVKKFPNALVLVSGCYAQLDCKNIEKISKAVKVFPGMQKGLLAKFPEYYYQKLLLAPEKLKTEPLELSLDIFSAFTASYFVGSFYEAIQSGQNKNLALEKIKSKTLKKEKPQFAFELATDNFAFHSRATLKVQDGCNSACSFCRIHLARGASVSLQADKVIARAKKIEAAGKNEIVLTGVNLAQYESDGVHFPALLKMLLQNTNKIKFRISSFYPEAISADFLDAISSERVCPYFHLSIQSGSERILELMKRPANVEKFYKVCEALRSVKFKPFIGADIIAGFPSESDEDFEKTYTLCKELAFAHIHAFPFSPRPKTLAYTLKPKVPERIVGERVARLNVLSEANYKAYLKTVSGSCVTGIVEISKTERKILTENYLLLPLKGKENAENLKSGSLVKVKLNEAFCELCSV